MDCGTLKSHKTGKLYEVKWERDTHRVYIKEITGSFFGSDTCYVGKASDPEEAVAKANTHIQYS